MIVAKFGGSSVATAAGLRQVKHFLDTHPDCGYVVVSAAGRRFPGDSKVTDLLRSCIVRRNTELPYAWMLQHVIDRHNKLIRDLGIDLSLDDEYRALHSALVAGASAAFIESRGEYLMALIVSKFLGRTFADAEFLIAFDKDGNFLEDLSHQRTAYRLGRLESAVIPGYYGGIVGKLGAIKVFPRGGSDITGAIVAAAVNAKLYANCTDVHGVMSADPRVVEGAETIPSMTYRELQELAVKGATVIHPDALFPVMQAGIPTWILNTADPEGPHTEITVDGQVGTGKILGLAGRQGFVAITVRSIQRQMLKTEVGFTLKIFEILRDLNIPYEYSTDSADSVTILIADEYLRNGVLSNICDGIYAAYPNIDISQKRNISVIAIVGEGMIRAIGTAAKIFTSLANANVNVELHGQATEIAITVGVASVDYEKAMNALHRDCVRT